MPKTVLQRAKRAFFRKRYADVITLLEPNVIQYRDNFQFYYFLGLACLHTGDIGGATSYFQRARQIKLRDPDLLAAQAALHLRRGDTHQAVEYYLEALEYNPEHAISKKSLDFIRKKGDEETISALVETGKIARFFPMPHKPLPLAPIAVISVATMVIAAVVLFAPRMLPSGPNGGARADLSELALDRSLRKASVELGGSYKYILSADQVVSAYESAQRNFQNYRDNAAQVEINRILYSNASTGIKQKARTLMTYLGEPGFDDVKDNYPYSKVIEDSSLYLDCWVIWKGMATNARATDNTVDFDLLVGYDTRNTLEGIVTVHFDTVVTVDSERPLEVLARISSEDGKVVLKGSAIHQSGKPGSDKY
jgi:tetratricopeptide (TPR) repeat protein